MSGSDTLSNPTEIQERLKRRYLDRLVSRVKKLRRDLVDRDWPALRTECRQLRLSGESFGFVQITQLALHAESLLPEEDSPRARSYPETRIAIEALISVIDEVLIEHYSGRN